MINLNLKFSVLLVVSATILLTSCHLLNSDTAKKDGLYPVELEPLSSEVLEAKNIEFHESTKTICSELNEFGLTVGDGCYGPGDSLTTALDEVMAERIAISALTTNSEFTNIYSESDLTVKDIRNMPRSNNKHWRVIFAEQNYEGIIIQNTEIYVWLTAEGVYRIGGHWYNHVYIPEEFSYDNKNVLATVMDHEIHYSSWTGSNILKVTPDHLPDPSTLQTVIIPYKNDDKLQLRLSWQIPISSTSESTSTGWYLYVDVMDGILLETRQLIAF